MFTQETDQSSPLHKIWYKYVDETPEFLKLFESFARMITKRFDEPAIFQAKPTVRFHLPGNLAVGEFHKDKDYNHSPKEINVFIPLTEAVGNNTIWIESEEDKGDYRPMEGTYGDYFVFDGANLKHGNRLNNTRKTRVSFDFRLLRKSDYDTNEKRVSTSQNKRFMLGEYWNE